ncbi:hypothetical protein JD292_02635 [Leucobacter sp. CSA2]|uniref:Uncharacterized protein n=1 Tax=Leucobacter edaphi TaxID=2796472 RepID=A0A934UVV5_9MICO|nr:hypothetical protein [Leucobacter edaphi]MBK0420979.1 hypothetical protein [Leucobacter edaphi]
MTFGTRSRPRAALPLLAAGAALALPLAGCSAGPAAPPEPRKLSASQAGGAYLDAVCPVNAAWDEADVQIDRLRLALERGDGSPEAAQRALVSAGTASATAAKRLDPAVSEWPEAAAPAVENVRQTLIEDERQAARVAKLSAEELANYTWKGAEESGKAAAAARKALALPDDPAFACSEWEAQGQKQGSKPGQKDEREQPSDG